VHFPNVEIGSVIGILNLDLSGANMLGILSPRMAFKGKTRYDGGKSVKNFGINPCFKGHIF
jgi:hypothetical protein